MSNLFYHLTDIQWKKIEFFFPPRKRRGLPPLALVIGTAFIIISGNGSESVFLRKSYCKVHKHGLGARKRNQAIGKSRRVILTGGQNHDSEPALELLAGIELAGKKVLADKAFSSELSNA